MMSGSQTKDRSYPQRISMYRYPKVVVFGDSLTQGGSHNNEGWVTRLQRYFLRRADVLNRGFSGWNTRWAKAAIQAAIDAEFPPADSGPSGSAAPSPSPISLATLWLGANDAACAGEAGGERRRDPDGPDPDYVWQHVPVAEYEQNVYDIAKMILAAADCLLLMTPPCVAEQPRIAFLLENANAGTHLDRSNESVRKYRDAVLRVGERLREEWAMKNKALAVIDTYELFYAERNTILHPDGLHFNWRGEEMVYKTVVEGLFGCGVTDSAVTPSERGEESPYANVVKIIAGDAQSFEKFRVTPDPVTKHFGHGRSKGRMEMIFPYWNDREGMKANPDNPGFQQHMHNMARKRETSGV